MGHSLVFGGKPSFDTNKLLANLHMEPSPVAQVVITLTLAVPVSTELVLRFSG